MDKSKKYFLYLSGVISENQYYEELSPMPSFSGGGNSGPPTTFITPEPEEDEKSDYNKTTAKLLFNKLALKIGNEKVNEYRSLINYVARNQAMIDPFMKLVEDLGSIQPSKIRNILNKF